MSLVCHARCCLAGDHLNTEAHNGHWNTGTAAPGRPGTPAMILQADHQQLSRVKISSKTRHHDEVISDILGPLDGPLMKGGVVVPSLTRQH